VIYALALLSAGLYGAADFLGGLATRAATATVIVAIAQATGFLALLLVFPFLPDATPHASDLAWGAAAGLAGGVGVALLYRALAIGTMGVVAPITAVCAVLIPVAAEMLSGVWPPVLALGGIVVALVAIVLVSQPPKAGVAPVGARPPGRPAGLLEALLSGIAIGFFFLLLAHTRQEAVLWPVLTARAASVVLFGALVAVRRASRAVPRRALVLAAGAGVLDMSANALYLLASHEGSVSTVVTLASLYPASTVLLAAMLLGERVSRLQGLGIVCALVAVVLIVGGAG
jgi:uncharacterized membrane protein